MEWVSGQENIRELRLGGHGNSFCTNCGSPLPHMDLDKTKWFVPAGLLDEDPGVGVRGHIWVSSKPTWDVIGDDAPQFPEGAPK